jgi:Ca-activated chloride channel family protein
LTPPLSRIRFSLEGVAMSKKLKLAELAQAAGVSARAVRYYVQRGLLPPPEFHGPDTAYTEEHLERLRAIKILQQRYMPLEAIDVELRRRSLDELRRWLADPAGGGGDGGPASTGAGRAREPAAAWGRALEEGEDHPDEGLWRRFKVAEGIELHVRSGRAREARGLFEDAIKEVERWLPKRWSRR